MFHLLFKKLVWHCNREEKKKIVREKLMGLDDSIFKNRLNVYPQKCSYWRCRRFGENPNMEVMISLSKIQHWN